MSAALKNPLTGAIAICQQESSDGKAPYRFGHLSPRSAPGLARHMPQTDISATHAPRWHVVEAEYKRQDEAYSSLLRWGCEAYLAKEVRMVRKSLHGVQQPPEPVFVPVFFQFLFARFDAAREWPPKIDARGRGTGIKRVMIGTDRGPATVPDARIAELVADQTRRMQLPERRMGRLKPGLVVLVREGWHPIAGDLAGRTAFVARCNGYHTEITVVTENGINWNLTLRRSQVSDE